MCRWTIATVSAKSDVVVADWGRVLSVEISAEDLNRIQFGVKLTADHLAFGPEEIIGRAFMKFIAHRLEIALPLGDHQIR